MKIIRDEECGGLMMIPLFCDWNIRRCNVEGCREKPSTIVTQMPNELPPSGMCEAHYQEANTPGGTQFSFEWDDYDAFDTKGDGEKEATDA